MPRWPLAALVAGLAGGAVVAVPPAVQQQTQKDAPKDAADAAKRVQVDPGLKVSLWASEPLLANPVSFAFDHKGACYVAETTRFGNGVPDTRGYMQWLDDDIGARTVDDRLKMYGKFKYTGYEEFSDQLRRVVDTKGAGKADASTVFAGGFNKLQDGLAAGVLARDGGVYFTCIPSLYHLKDTKGDGVADQKQVLSTGYGVRAQFLGHDLHGLRVGPDGKLYFSIGDRGFTVTTKEGKTLANTDSGAVLRCDLDGANLEIVHVGLRNPQELAFDDFGNLFTYDNNSDSGDRARWVHIVEGGDSGWRCGYQYGTLMHHNGVPQGNRGPWNTEGIWHVPSPESTPPAYVVPALKHFGNGPSGITAYPGVGLNDKYKHHFFACDFTASAGNSQVWSLECKPKGASFEVVDLQGFVKSMVPTDCEFGPDGAFYVLDWVGGWSPPGKGRIFRITDDKATANPAVAEAKKLLADGFKGKSDAELAKLLGHAHRDVRYEAQFALVARRRKDVLSKVLAESEDKLARLHAVWGLSRVAPWSEYAKAALDSDADVRIAAAKTFAVVDVPGLDPERDDKVISTVKTLLADSDGRVRAAAAVTYGSLLKKASEPVDVEPTKATHKLAPLFDLLAANNDADAYLRQAAVEGLVRATRSANDLFNAWKLGGEPLNKPAVRMGVVLALRKLQGEQLANFLTDSEPKVVAEAARAIYDEGVTKAMPALAALAATPNLPEPVAYRAAAANYKLGTPEAAGRVAAVAARSNEVGHLREFALKLLAEWEQPGRRDPITGLRQEIAARNSSAARDAVRPVLKSLFTGPDAVRKEAASTTAKLGVGEVGPFMKALVLDGKQPASSRVEALYALAEVKGKELGEVTAAALADPEPRVRAAARVVAAKADPKAASKALPALLADAQSDPLEKQAALLAMGTLPESSAVDAALAGLLDAATKGELTPELKLELVESAAARVKAKDLKLSAPLKDKLAALDKADRAREAKDGPNSLARYRDALAGGDAARGREVFLNSAAVYCQRCHKVDGQGGEVGPTLNGIGSKHPRDYLLEAIVHPNAKIAEGYQSVIVSTLDGRTVSGVLRAKDAKGLTVVTPENKVIVIPADDVESERPDKSAMPDDLHKKLTRRELRDVVEFLASLKGAPTK